MWDMIDDLGQCYGHDGIDRCGNKAEHLGCDGEGLCSFCKDKQDRALDEQNREWQKVWSEAKTKHPQACETCRGAGWSHHCGSFEEPPSADPCPDCLEVGQCPRCGSLDLMPDYGVTVVGKHHSGNMCAGCGWFDGLEALCQPVLPTHPWA